MGNITGLRELVTSKKELELNRNKLTSLEVQLRAIEIAGDMASLVEPHDMTPWYCKAYKTIGEGRYIAVANMARKGTHPSRLFGWLLKQEMERCQ